MIYQKVMIGLSIGSFLLLNVAWAEEKLNATPQRPTFTSDTSTVPRGSVELETGVSGTTSDGRSMALPNTLKTTPGFGISFLQDMELSLGADLFRSVSSGGNRDNGFGNALAFGLRKPFTLSQHFSMAVAPSVLVFLQNESGVRLGATLIGALIMGSSSLVLNATPSAATVSSAGNSAFQLDVSFDFTRSFGRNTSQNKWSWFAGALTQDPSNGPMTLSLEQGVTYRIKPSIVLDLAVQETGLKAGDFGYLVLAGATVNFGRL